MRSAETSAVSGILQTLPEPHDWQYTVVAFNHDQKFIIGASVPQMIGWVGDQQLLATIDIHKPQRRGRAPFLGELLARN
jgi:hypothetical protein